MVETVIRHKNNVNIACLGPLTNIARAFESYLTLPSFINTLYIMGHADIIETKKGKQVYLNYRPHNFKVDPEAVDIVFASSVQKVVIPTKLAKKHWLRRDKFMSMPKTDPVGNYISLEGMRWLDKIGHENSFLYDPLTVAHHGNPKLTEKVSHDAVSVATAILPSSERFENAVFDSITQKDYKPRRGQE